MGKFFQKGPDKCSICGEEKPIIKKARTLLMMMYFCQDCYDKYYKEYAAKATEKAMQDIKAGRIVQNHQELEKRAVDVTTEIIKENKEHE